MSKGRGALTYFCGAFSRLLGWPVWLTNEACLLRCTLSPQFFGQPNSTMMCTVAYLVQNLMCMSTGSAAEEDSSAVVEAEGLAAYAGEALPEGLLEAAGGANGSPCRADPALIEELQGLLIVLAQRHLPALQDALRVCVRVDVLRSH